MDLVLVRHGRPYRIEDAPTAVDPDLTDLGHLQAEAAARWLAEEQIDAIYTSPMARARQTAAPLEKALGMTAVVADGVQEYDADSKEYIPIEDLKADRERWRHFVATHVQQDRSAFGDTVVSTLEEIVAGHRGQRVAVVCHGGVINMWAAHVLSRPLELFFEPHYTSINRFLAASSGERSIVSLNEVGHLRQLEQG